MQTSSAIRVVQIGALAAVLGLTGCASAPEPQPHSLSDLQSMWIAIGGEADLDATLGSDVGRWALTEGGLSFEPEECLGIESLLSNELFLADETLSSTDPWIQGGVYSPGIREESSSLGLTDTNWVGTARVFVSPQAAGDYLSGLERTASECPTYSVVGTDDPGGRSQVDAPMTTTEIGGTPMLVFAVNGSIYVFQQENLVFALFPLDVEDVAADLEAYLSILG